MKALQGTKRVRHKTITLRRHPPLKALQGLSAVQAAPRPGLIGRADASARPEPPFFSPLAGPLEGRPGGRKKVERVGPRTMPGLKAPAWTPLRGGKAAEAASSPSGPSSFLSTSAVAITTQNVGKDKPLHPWLHPIAPSGRKTAPPCRWRTPQARLVVRKVVNYRRRRNAKRPPRASSESAAGSGTWEMRKPMPPSCVGEYKVSPRHGALRWYA